MRYTETMNATIYLAEDEIDILRTVAAFLTSEGYRVETFENGQALLDRFVISPCDLVITDVNMPLLNGFELTQALRQRSAVPIIVLTARDTDLDYATGINLGSDDYFTKPFSAIALVMRVKALLRRVDWDSSSSKSSEKDVLEWADVTLDPKTLVVRSVKGSLDLTPMEYQVLKYLLEHADSAISRNELLDRVWGYTTEVETRACDDTVRRLRKKLEGTRLGIETVWGFGFKLAERPQ